MNETWPQQLPPPRAAKVLAKNTPFRSVRTPADTAWIDAETNKRVATYVTDGREVYLRQVAQMFHTVWFDDWPPSQKKHWFALYPPLAPDGSVPMWMGEGTDYQILAAEFPADYERLVTEYGRLIRDELEKQIEAAGGVRA